MPTYEYRCPNGHEFEKFFRSISGATTEHPCPECGVIGVRQLSGGAGFMFKGSGFYLTDYGKNAHARKDPAKSGAEASAGGAPGPGSGGEHTSGPAGGGESSGAAAPGPEPPATSSGTEGAAGSATTPKPKPGE